MLYISYSNREYQPPDLLVRMGSKGNRSFLRSSNQISGCPLIGRSKRNLDLTVRFDLQTDDCDPFAPERPLKVRIQYPNIHIDYSMCEFRPDPHQNNFCIRRTPQHTSVHYWRRRLSEKRRDGWSPN